MDFGAALEALKGGQAVSREEWQYVGERVCYQPGYPDGVGINANTAAATGLPEGTVCAFRPYLLYRHPDGSFEPWVPTHADLLADDWHAAWAPTKS